MGWKEQTHYLATNLADKAPAQDGRGSMMVFLPAQGEGGEKEVKNPR